jgi:hypothetical protein
VFIGIHGRRWFSLVIHFIDWLFNRDNVEGLIKHVPNARFKGFSSHAAAAQYYFDAKMGHKVKIVRDTGDHIEFGPMCSAAQ